MVALGPLPTLFALHRRHRAGVVPALAPVLLVRGVIGVLAAVVAAELLALRGLARAPHVLAVHADPPIPVRFAEDRPSSPRVHVVCLSRAVSTWRGPRDRIALDGRRTVPATEKRLAHLDV